MFTGIVERVAVVSTVEDTGGGLSLKLEVHEASHKSPWRSIEAGESVSVNGACLTAVDFDNESTPAHVSFDVVPESLAKTALGGLRVGDEVNIERALRVGDSFGGHYVTGHVDGTGEIVGMDQEGDQTLFRVSASRKLIAQMLDKGSIAVDGVSLTVVEVNRAEYWFTFAAIPHTLGLTTLGKSRVGDLVNLETDAFGKWALHGLELEHLPEERLNQDGQ